MNRSDMAKCLGTAALLVPNSRISEPMIDAWLMVFGKLEAPVFFEALMTRVQEPGRKWFPAVGEVTEVLSAKRKPLSDAVTGGEAWLMVRELARSVGTSREKDARHALEALPRAMAALRQVGGLERVMYADLDRDMPWIEKRFLEHYAEMMERDEERVRLTPSLAIGQEAKKLLALTGKVN